MAFRKFNNFKKKKFEPRLPGTAVAVVNGNVDKAIRKLKKKLQKENFFNEMRNREFFETRSEKKRKEKAASTRRCIKKREKSRALEV
tara:strand:- start:3114 stop:3374 length:261 start_codon:yes stop_codon:yes gene_type:complete